MSESTPTHPLSRVKERRPKNKNLESIGLTEVEKQRFWEKVDIKSPDECWEWKERKNEAGYGINSVWRDGAVQIYAHRIAHFLTKGLKSDLVVDHLCCNKGCVNPAHLEAVSSKENSQRHTRKVTHCPAGHEYTPENTRPCSKGKRGCKTCNRIYIARKRAKERESRTQSQ